MPETLVVGGTRNMGPELVAALLADGHRVTVLNRGVTAGELPDGVERLRADRSDPKSLASALRGRSFELVVDTTLYNGPDAGQAARILDGRAGRYVFWSTGQVYLVRTGPTPPFREADYDGPVMAEPPAADTVDHDNWVYGVEKRAAEDELREAFASRRFPYVSLRMPMINSVRDHYRRLDAYVGPMLAARIIEIPDDQDRLRLRHVAARDVVSASLRAAAAPPGTRVNISQDETLTLDGMLAKIGAILGVTPRVVAKPRAELEARGVLPRGSPWSGRWMSALDNALSKEVLGMRYTSVDEYLPELVAAAKSRVTNT